MSKVYQSQDSAGVMLEWRVAGKKSKMRVGKLSAAQIATIRGKLELMLYCREVGDSYPVDLLRWIDKIQTDNADLHAKLVKHGLIEPKVRVATTELTIGVLADAWLRWKEPDVAPLTVAAISTSVTIIKAKLGERLPQSISSSDAAAFRSELAGEYAQATVAKIIKHVKQFWKFATKTHGVVGNPWEDVVAGTQVNHERDVYVQVQTVENLLSVCDDTELGLVIALSRFGGLRIVSELMGLRWKHLTKDTITIASPKTKRYGKASREAPITQNLSDAIERHKQFLRKKHNYSWSKFQGVAMVDDIHVIEFWRHPENTFAQRLRTGVETLIAKWNRAGGEPITIWPRLFHGMRASLETDLMARYDISQVCKWLGNSPKVALEHYARSNPNKLKEVAGIRLT